jgi:hypothetical protein
MGLIGLWIVGKRLNKLLLA